MHARGCRSRTGNRSSVIAPLCVVAGSCATIAMLLEKMRANSSTGNKWSGSPLHPTGGLHGNAVILKENGTHDGPRLLMLLRQMSCYGGAHMPTPMPAPSATKPWLSMFCRSARLVTKRWFGAPPMPLL